MDDLKQAFTNRCILIPFFLWLAIQMIKFVTDLIVNKKINFKRLLGAGGMPSSHSAVVSSLAMCVGKQYGFGSGIFAIAWIMALVVMYDAAGVRRAAGKQARILNRIIESDGKDINVQDKLVELLGHTPVEVFVGFIVGILMGVLFCHLWDL